MTPRFIIGFLLFPDLLQLDLTGAYGVLASGPGAEVHLAWKDTRPVLSSDKLTLTPTVSLQDCPDLDVLVVPGGSGIVSLLNDDEVLGFLRNKAQKARFICSVCTGSLVLGAAGLLRGRKAATHWLSLDLLKPFGALPQKNRIVVDGNCITAAGVTSGIDMALVLAGLLWGESTAQGMQLAMQYAPDPPYAAGTPETAPQEIYAAAIVKGATRQEERRRAVMAASMKE